MNEIKFSWDLKKDLLNRRKHGVAFEEARTVFFDEQARLIHDPDHSEAEERFLLLGMSHKFRLIIVSHAIWDETTIRIISARRPNAHERKEYIRHLS